MKSDFVTRFLSSILSPVIRNQCPNQPRRGLTSRGMNGITLESHGQKRSIPATTILRFTKK